MTTQEEVNAMARTIGQKTAHVKFYCDVCGLDKAQDVHAYANGVPFTSGYGTDASGRKVCYECCADQDRAYMREHGRITLYLTLEKVQLQPAIIGTDPRLGGRRVHRVTNRLHYTQRGFRETLYHAKVTNWPGSLSIEVSNISAGRHNIAGTRYDVWFTFEGERWHGVQYGEYTQLCHCKRLKS